MKNPEDDVELADGMGFIIESAPYKQHIKENKEQKQVCNSWLLIGSSIILPCYQRSGCWNHCAINEANLNRKNRDATDICACACALHDCFVPHSVVYFQKGERYMYCSKWVIVFAVLTLLVAVGKFHFSAHVQECFVLYSLNFIFGAGQLDGEILKTL